MPVTSMPVLWSERMAVSRPEPGPFTCTSTLRTPCSIAPRAAFSDGVPAIVLWPNADAGSEHIAAGIRQFREHNDDSQLHFFKNLPTSDYIKLMSRTAALVGNSSSAIREGAFIGTPAVNIGPRQDGRDRGGNVVDVDYDGTAIADAVRSQMANGRYEMEPIYGDGHAGERIADVLATKTISIHKRITY